MIKLSTIEPAMEGIFLNPDVKTVLVLFGICKERNHAKPTDRSNAKLFYKFFSALNIHIIIILNLRIEKESPNP